MPNDPDPIHEQRRVQRQYLDIARRAIGDVPVAEPLEVNLDAERDLRARADQLLASPAGEWLRASRAVEIANAEYDALATVRVHKISGDAWPTAEELLSATRKNPGRLSEQARRREDEPIRTVLEFTALAIAADRLAEPAKTQGA